MTRTRIIIHIIPSKYVVGGNIDKYIPNAKNWKISSVANIFVNEVDGMYHIIFYSDIFDQLEKDVLINGIISLIENNIERPKLISISYDSIILEDGVNMLTVPCVKNIIELQNILSDVISNKDKRKWEFEILQNVVDAANFYVKHQKECEEWREEHKDDNKYKKKISNRIYDKPEIRQEEPQRRSIDLITKAIEDMQDFEDEDDSVFGKNKKRKKRKSLRSDKKKHYSSSKLIKIKDAKKSYNRHGVIVSSKKSIIERDENVIKDFLKDFIPGNGWKKDLRKDLLERWMSVFVITKKQLKRIEKREKERKESNDKYKKARKVINVAGRLISTPIDHWNDPSR